MNYFNKIFKSIFNKGSLLNKILSFLVFFFLLHCGVAQQTITAIDSAKKIVGTQKNDKALIQNYFFIADEYMNVEQYDSAQIWLNKIHAEVREGCIGDIKKMDYASVRIADLGPISDDFYGWELSFSDDEPAHDIVDEDEDYFN